LLNEPIFNCAFGAVKRRRIGFRHFLPESGEEDNPDNPVNPVKKIK
jgi:hypothetical protein